MTTVSVEAKQVAEHIAKQLDRIAVPSSRHRPDIGNVQVDPCRIGHGVWPKPGIHIQFDIQGGYGVEFNIVLEEFAKDPGAYMRNLFARVVEMKQMSAQARDNRIAANNEIYRRLTQGASHG